MAVSGELVSSLGAAAPASTTMSGGVCAASQSRASTAGFWTGVIRTHTRGRGGPAASSHSTVCRVGPSTPCVIVSGSESPKSSESSSRQKFEPGLVASGAEACSRLSFPLGCVASTSVGATSGMYSRSSYDSQRLWFSSCPPPSSLEVYSCPSREASSISFSDPWLAVRGHSLFDWAA